MSVIESNHATLRRGTFTPQAWRAFLARYWDTEPWVTRAPGGEAFVAPEHVLDALRGYGKRKQNEYAHNVDTSCKVLYSTGEFLCTRHLVAPFLPTDDETSMEGYERRVVAQARRGTFAIETSRAQRYSFELWHRTREFLLGLFQALGALPERAGVSIFAGNYPRTPFGLHADGTSVFVYCVYGEKRMVLFDKQVWEQTGRSPDDYDAVRHLGQEHTLRPGDMLYMPSDRYHVGENDGFSVSISIGVTWPRAFDAVLFAADALKAVAALAGPLEARSSQGTPLPTMPAALSTAVARLEQVAGTPTFTALVEQAWIQHLSAGAMPDVPRALPPGALGGREVLRVLGPDAVLTHRVGDSLLIAACGAVICLPYDVALADRVQGLWQSGEFVVGDWCDSLPADQVVHGGEILEFLRRARAVEVVAR